MAYLERSQKLLVIIGPSGAGKTTVINLLQERGLIVVTPSWTTRPARPEEASGAVEHHFVSDQEFTKKEAEGFFLDSVQMFGLPFKYGLPKIEAPASGVIPTVMLRASLLPLLQKHHDNFVIYQIEDDLNKIKDRLLKRQSEGQELGSRLEDYQKEVTAGQKIANRVFSNQTTVDALADQIAKALNEDFS